MISLWSHWSPCSSFSSFRQTPSFFPHEVPFFVCLSFVNTYSIHHVTLYVHQQWVSNAQLHHDLHRLNDIYVADHSLQLNDGVPRWSCLREDDILTKLCYFWKLKTTNFTFQQTDCVRFPIHLMHSKVFGISFSMFLTVWVNTTKLA